MIRAGGAWFGVPGLGLRSALQLNPAGQRAADWVMQWRPSSCCEQKKPNARKPERREEDLRTELKRRREGTSEGHICTYAPEKETVRLRGNGRPVQT